jgi:hypothetical protein
MTNYSKQYLEYKENKSREYLGYRSQKEMFIVGILLVGLSFIMFLK